jgi:hypothetical protein
MRRLNRYELSICNSSFGRHKLSIHRDCIPNCKTFVVNVFDNRVEISRSGIDSRNAIPAFFETGGVNPCINIKGDYRVNNGRYLIDQDESNEDVVVAYFEDIIDS